MSRLPSALAIARADGRYPKLLESLAKTEPLLDGMAPALTALHRSAARPVRLTAAARPST